MSEKKNLQITGNDIVAGLKAVGLAAGDVVIVHSSLSSMGNVKGGADTVIDALLEVVGDEGTVVMPTFPADKPFKKDTSPTYLGRVPETFRKRKGSLRSLHPLVPVSAIGKHARYIVQNHEKCDVPQGMDSPYGKIYQLNGKVLLIGVDLDRCTMMHLIEVIAEAPYLSQAKGEYIDHKGKKVQATYRQFPGPHRDFIGLTRWFIEAGIATQTAIGRARVMLINAKDLVDQGLEAIAEDPAAVLCENPNCSDCITQRRAVYRRDLNRRSFKLSAVSDLAGRYLDEIIENLNRYAIEHLELFHIQGRELFQLEPGQIRHIFNRLKSAGIKVSGIRLSNAARFEHVLKIAEQHSVEHIIVPMNESLKVGLKGENSIRVILENTTQLAAEACLILEKSREQGFGLAFNPANFARVKEKPFLKSLTRGRVKKFIHQLYINDSTFDGTATPLACGNAEIKELISILTCSGFDGYFVLEGSPAEIDYDQRVTQLFAILDEL